MANALEKMVNLINDIDDSDHKNIVTELDKIANRIGQIKTAQYVGVQGYWIRNERCWANCYRQKRANRPKMSAQEVWSECQNEYVDSINNPKSGWEKYAGGFQFKTAQNLDKAHQEKIASIIENERNLFNKKLWDRTENQEMSLPVAVFDIVDERTSQFREAYIEEGLKLVKLASKLKETNHKEIAIKLASIADDMIKESGWFGGTNQYYDIALRQVQDILQSTYSSLSGLYQGASRAASSQDQRVSANFINQFFRGGYLDRVGRLLANTKGRIAASARQSFNWGSRKASPILNTISEKVNAQVDKLLASMQQLSPKKPDTLAVFSQQLGDTAQYLYGVITNIDNPETLQQEEKKQQGQRQVNEQADALAKLRGDQGQGQGQGQGELQQATYPQAAGDVATQQGNTPATGQAASPAKQLFELVNQMNSNPRQRMYLANLKRWLTNNNY